LLLVQLFGIVWNPAQQLSDVSGLHDFWGISGIDVGAAAIRCFIPLWNEYWRFGTALAAPLACLGVLFVMNMLVSSPVVAEVQNERQQSVGGFRQWYARQTLRFCGRGYLIGNQAIGLAQQELVVAALVRLSRQYSIKRVAILVMTSSYATQCSYAMSMLQCRVGHLAADPNLSCESALHDAFKAIAIVVLIVVGAGYPLAICLACLCKSRLQRFVTRHAGTGRLWIVQQILFLQSELSRQFVETVPFWEAVLMLRKLVILYTLRFGAADYSRAVGICCLVVLYSVTVILSPPHRFVGTGTDHAWKRSWCRMSITIAPLDVMNSLEVFGSILISVAFVLAALAFQGALQPRIVSAFLGISSFSFVLVCAASLAIRLARARMSSRGSNADIGIQQRIRESFRGLLALPIAGAELSGLLELLFVLQCRAQELFVKHQHYEQFEQQV